jgi:hypothetical protein
MLNNALPDGLYTGEAEGYRMNKFEVKTAAMGSLGNDFPFFRYSQVLMMKAECLLPVQVKRTKLPWFQKSAPMHL